MNYISCNHCGVVVDSDVAGLGPKDIYNHDQDKKSDAVMCPVCKNFISTNPKQEASHD